MRHPIPMPNLLRARTDMLNGPGSPTSPSWALSMEQLPSSDGSPKAPELGASLCTRCSSVVGSLSVIGGLLLLWWSAPTAHRKEAASTVQTAVDNWAQHYEADWSASKWTLLVNGLERAPVRAGNVSISLTGMQSIVASGALELHNLVGVVMPEALHVAQPSGNRPHVPITERLGQEYNLSLKVQGPGAAQQEIPLYNGPLVQSTLISAGSWKQCQYQRRGLWQPKQRRCRVWDMVAQLCVKVEFDTGSRRWGLSSHDGGTGCHAVNGGNPVQRRMMAVYGRSKPALAMGQLQNSKLVVYHERDPYLCVENMTKGGMILAEDSLNEAALGAVLVFMGFLLCAPGFLIMLLEWPSATPSTKGDAYRGRASFDNLSVTVVR